MAGLEQAQDLSQQIGTDVVSALIPEDSGRRYLLVQNVSSSAYIGLSVLATTPSVDSSGNGGLGTIVLGPGEGMTFDTEKNPANGFNGVASASGTNVTIIQW